MKVTFTNKQEIDYLESLVRKDTEKLQEKLKRRNKILTTIYLDKELGDFHS